MTLDEIEKRLKVLEDIEAIKQMHINYILALNEQKFEEMIGYFTDDAIVDGLGGGQICEGKAAITKFFRDMAERNRVTKMWKGGQILVHPVISVEGDKATGCLTWFRVSKPKSFVSADGMEMMIIAPTQARYDMEYQRVEGEWKMSKMKFTNPWPSDQWPK